MHKKDSQLTSLTELVRTRGEGSSANHHYLEDARSERSVTYKQLAQAAARWKRTLLAAGVAPGSAVLVDLADPIAFSVAHVSLIAAGYRSIPIDPNGPWSELARLSELIGGARLVVSDRQGRGELEGALLVGIDPVTGLPEGDDRQSSIADTSAKGSIIIFTSGSTGTPKGVELTERQLLYVARAIANHNKLQGSDRGFNSLPLFHINAEVVGLLSTLVAGATLVLDQRFHRDGFWELLAERRITWLNAVPAILAILARGGKIQAPDTLRFIRSASAPLPDAIREAFADIELVVSYGMTEGASQITATPLGEPKRPGSVGIPIGNEVTVRDEAGETLPVGEVGFLWIRGEGIIRQYIFGRASERFDADGWLSTGDVGKLDKDGYVYLMGRSDDVINRGGEKLYPSEIEDVILKDPRVREVVVTARSDEILGQVPVAYVIPVTTDIDPAEFHTSLVERCERSLSRFKRPATVTIVEDLPRAATGKVQRVRVRAMDRESVAQAR